MIPSDRDCKNNKTLLSIHITYITKHNIFYLINLTNIEYGSRKFYIFKIKKFFE